MDCEKPINVAVFVDYENVHKSLLQQQTNVLRLAFFEKLREWCKNHNKRVVRISVYCNFDNTDLHDSYHQSTLQRYGVETIHTSNQGKNYADLKIAIDVLTAMYSNDNIDEFFIVSNDKDMTPLLNTIRENKRNVTIITTGDTYNPAICEFADNHIGLEEICKTDLEHKIIDDITNHYWEDLVKQIKGQIEKFERKEVDHYGHFGLDFTLKRGAKFEKVMTYELAHIIQTFYEEGKVFFYHYTYRETKNLGISISECREKMVTLGLIKEDDIVENYDMSTYVESQYLNYTRN